MTLKNLIGTDLDQVSRNRDLGTLAYTDPNGVRINGGAVKNSTFNTIEYKDPYQNTDRVSILPTLNLDFVRNNQLDPRFTFTRTSTATYTGKDGLIKTAAVNEPRFDYDPLTHNCKGLLIEESRTNSFVQSENFATSWTPVLTTVTTNQTVAPDGTTTADKIVATATSGDHYVHQSPSVTNGSPYTMSVYAKSAGNNRFQLFFASTRFPGTGRRAMFDVSTGTVVVVESGVAATITNVGDGWYRCSITATATSTGTGFNGISVLSNTETIIGNSWTGDGINGLYFWGTQFELGPWATSYIPTTTAAITRTYDSLLLTGLEFNNIYNPVEGTLVAEASGLGNYRSSTWANGCVACLSTFDGTTNNFIAIEFESVNSTSATGAAVFEVYYNGANNVGLSSDFYYGNNVKFVGAYKANDSAFALSTQSNVLTDIVSTIPVCNTLSIGQFTSIGSRPINGYIKKFAYYPKRLSNATLQELTK